jgi:hypothetical protein
MALQNPSPLREANKKILVIKYALILLALVATIPFFFPVIEIKPGSGLASLRDSILVSAIVSLLLSIFNDIILREQADVQTKEERQEFANEFATQFFERYAVTAVPDSALAALLRSGERRGTIISALSQLVVNDPALQPIVSRGYFEPIQKPPKYKNLSAISKLTNFDINTGSYLWNCQQRFTTINSDLNFRVFVCNSPEISGKLETAGRALDFIILLSEYEPNEIKMWFETDFGITGRKFDTTTNRFRPVAIKKTSELTELISNSQIEGITEADGFYCRFYTQGEPGDVEYTMAFKHPLSLFDDPYFCWTFQEYSFV